MNLRKICFGFFMLFILVGCQKESSTLMLDNNWADITLQEKGIGTIHPEKGEHDSVNRLESYRDAKIDLYKKLEADIMSLKIDAKRDIKAFIGTNQKLREKVSAFLKGTRITEAVYTPRKGMELSGQLYLGESFKSILGLMEKKSPEEKGTSRSQQTTPSPGSGF